MDRQKLMGDLADHKAGITETKSMVSALTALSKKLG